MMFSFLAPLLFLQQTPSATPAVDLAAALLGQRAPAFSLPDQNRKMRSLDSAKGKWLVLAFYPADMTTGCTYQNKSYSANNDQFSPLNALVWTISTQDVASKQAFCAKEALANTLLADTGGKTAAAYRVLNKERGVARRVTFYIDPHGKVAHVDTKIDVKRAAQDSLETLTQLQHPTRL